MTIIISLILALFTVISSPTLAADLNITCQSTGCVKDVNTPLFSQSTDGLWYPGRSLTKTFIVANNNSWPIDVAVSPTRSGLTTVLESAIFTDISGNSTSYQDSLLSFVQSPPIDLGILAAGASSVYTFTLDFDYQVGNEYQNLTSGFDLSLNPVQNASSFTPTPTPGSSSSSSVSSPGAPVCNESTPLAPTNLRITRSGTTAYLYWDSPSSSFTGYVLTYGPDRDTFLYGDPNVPLSNSYIVRDLNLTYQYCFKIRAQNGCAPGLAYSNTSCTNTAGLVSDSIPQIPGFESGVLGEQTSITPTATPTLIPDGIVAGANTSACTRFWFPILWVVALLFNLILTHQDRRPRITRFVIPVIISLVTFLVDYYLTSTRCCFVHPLYCQYFWIGSIISFLVPLFVFKTDRD